PGLVRTVALLRAVTDLRLDARVWSLTREAVATGQGESVHEPERAQVWGAGQVAAVELPEVWGGLVDLPEAADDRALDRLTALLASGTETQAAVRETGVYVRRLVPAAVSPGTARPFVPDGTWLVTEGVTGPGRHVA
ncbi:hypothetical protein G3I76_74700, partial [Streptomyces sp. SID11233]|nr:hypothetical protein [Streptomyces sp. SID11233]